MTGLSPRWKLVAVTLLVLIPLTILGWGLQAILDRHRQTTERLRLGSGVVSLAWTLAERLADLQAALGEAQEPAGAAVAREAERNYLAFRGGMGGLRRLVEEQPEQAGRLAALEGAVQAWWEGPAAAVFRGETADRSRAAEARAEIQELRSRLVQFGRAQAWQQAERRTAQATGQERSLILAALALLGVGLAAGGLLAAERARARRSLRESEERLRALFEEAPVAYHEIDAAGIVRRVNRTECELLGRPPEEILGRSIWEFVAPEAQAASREAVEAKLAERQPLAVTERSYLRADGSRIGVELHEKLIRDPAGRVRGIRTMLLDVTARQAAQRDLAESERRFETLVSQAPVGIFEADPRGECRYVNARWCAIAGLTPAEAAGEGWIRAIHPADRQEVFGAWSDAAAAGREFAREYRMQRPDGEISWVVGSAVAHRDGTGRVLGYFGTVRDITERKRAEEGLWTRTEQLDAVRGVTAEIVRELDLSPLLTLIVRRGVELAGGRAGAVYLWEEEAALLVPRAWHGRGEWLREVRIRPGQGVAGRVAERRAGLIVNDYRASEMALPALLAAHPATAVLAEPLLYRDRLLGVVTVDDAGGGRPFTETDREILRLFADQAAIAIQNARMVESLEVRAQRLETLGRLNRLVSSSLDLDRVLREIAHAATRLTGADTASFWLADPARRLLELRTFSREDLAADFQPREVAFGQGAVGWVALHRRSLHVPDVFADNSPVSHREWWRRLGLRSFYGLPVVLEGRLLAVLALNGREPFQFTGEAAVVLESFLSQATMAIRNAALYEDARRELEERKRAEARLRLQGVALESAANAILITDRSGEMVWINPAFTALTGYGLEEVRGRTPRLLKSGHHPAEFYQALWARIGAGETWEGELVNRRKDGSLYHEAMTIAPVADEQGGVTHFVAIKQDVTERRRAQGELERVSRQLQAVLDSATQVAIIATDPTGIIRIFNAGAERMLGYRAAELVGHETPQRFHLAAEVEAHGAELSRELGRPITGFEVFVERARAGGFEEREWTYVRKDGSQLTVLLVVTALRDAEERIAGFLGVARDITERKAVERMKDEFVSVVSHELRTPLTSIRGALGLLAGGLLGPMPEKGGRMLEIAVANTDRLVRLINDILDIERMESGRVVLAKEVCELDDLMTQAAEVMRPMGEQARVRLLVAPAAARLLVDPDRILQLFTNLLSNAIKFSPAGTTVRFEGAQVGRWVRVVVADQGRGIPPDKLEAIFERFRQVDASDVREKGGTGLGLAICRGIALQHGGRIWAESGAGAGSRLTLELPALPAPVAGAEAAERGDLVLVCEGDPEAAGGLERILAAGGYRAVTAGSLAAAVRAVRAARPEVILLGGLPPEQDGWVVLGALKEEPAARDVPVVLMGAMTAAARPARSSDQIASWLPRAPEAAVLLRAVEQAGASRGRPPRILVVEDDPDLAQILVAMFQRQGATVTQAGSGREALHACQEAPPDLLVLDVGLPDGDGFGLVERLRREDRLRQVPLVVYTARDLTAEDRARLVLGETEFLTKSRIPPEQLERHIGELLGRIVPREREPEGGSNDGATRAAGG